MVVDVCHTHQDGGELKLAQPKMARRAMIQHKRCGQCTTRAQGGAQRASSKYHVSDGVGWVKCAATQSIRRCSGQGRHTASRDSQGAKRASTRECRTIIHLNGLGASANAHAPTHTLPDDCHTCRVSRGYCAACSVADSRIIRSRRELHKRQANKR